MSLLALILAVAVAVRVWALPRQVTELEEELARRKAEQAKLHADLQRLRHELADLREAASTVPAAPPAPAVAVAAPPVAPVAPPVPTEPAPEPATLFPELEKVLAEWSTTPPAPAVPGPESVAPLPEGAAVLPEPAALPGIEAELPEPAWPVPPPILLAPPRPAPPRPRRPAPPVRTGPTWWERAATVLLENWTGILGAIILVTGVGFLGIYAALRLAPPYRFLLICGFAGAVLGARFALRHKVFARQLSGWLLSSAAAIFLFACVGAVSIPGLQWATFPFDYLLLLAGVSANLYLAWQASREEVATLHGVLSLVALAVLPPTAVTLGAAAGVTAFSIAITYRQLWKYQLLLSIASFFAFHLYWHQELLGLANIPNGLRLTAMGLVTLVGGAAAVVQYRSVYARRRFEPLLFAAHLLNWTCLGINLYLYSTGSVWKTIPLALGSLLTFWAGRRAKQLGLGWLFQTDTIISLILALATALSLQGWHATPLVIGLFMLLESLLVALIMARQGEALVYRVALAGALLAGTGLLMLAASHAAALPPTLYRDALVLALAGWAGLVFGQLIYRQPLLQDAQGLDAAAHRNLLGLLAVLAGLLQAGTGAVLARLLFGWSAVPVAGLLLALAGAALSLATWVRTAAVAPNWVRWQQLVLAQLFVGLAILGLHEAGLSWPLVWLLLYAESLLVVLLLAGRNAADLLHRGAYRAAAAGALAVGSTLLALVLSHLADYHSPTLYRDALLLALAGWGSLAAGQLALKHPLRQAVRPYLLPGSSFAPVSNALTHRELLSSIGGLGGVLQVGAGLLVARALFGWTIAPVAGLLAALLGLAGVALGLAAWLRTTALAPDWLRRQQLVLGQFFVVLAVLGLHELGLGWPAVLLILYAENLLVAALLSGRNEDVLLHIQTYLLVLQAALLPLLVRYLSPGVLAPTGRAALLLGAALLTVAYQTRRLFGRFPEAEYATLPLRDTYRLPLLGLLAGGLLLGAGSLVYEQPWVAWEVVGVLGALLYLRQRVAVPGLWAGLTLAAFGYMLLQWSHVAAYLHETVYVLFYLLPTVAVPLVGLWTSWWPAGGRFVRWPWFYLLGLHLIVALAAATPAGHVAYVALGLLALTGAAFAAAQAWRRTLPDAAAVARAGQPDRYLLHLTYSLLLAGLLTHLALLSAAETFFGQPAEYLTAAVFFVVAAAIALGRPPATEPVYGSWRLLHRWLPEFTLLFGTGTLAHNVRAPWLPLLWVSVALVINQVAGRLPTHFRRLAVYGRLYYELAAGTASLACLLYVQPSQLLHPDWWALAVAVALLFAYVALALRVGNAPFAPLSPAWAALAFPSRRQLEAALLYPAFVALSLLLIQSFDRSVLTVLLMLEVVAVFSTSLLLRRQDLRYVALAGMLGSVLRLVFFDLSRSGTITRAIVFIFMGLLLLGMNALYARFKARFAPEEDVREELAEKQL